VQEFFYRAGDIFIIDANYSHLAPEKFKNSKIKLVYLDFNKDRHKDNKAVHIAAYLYRHDTILTLIGLQLVDLVGKTVIDAGAGNGVIAIASALYGAEKAHILDKEKSLKDIIEDNAKRNGVLTGLDFSYFGKKFEELVGTQARQKADVVIMNTSKFGISGGELANVLSIFDCEKAVIAGSSYANLAGDIGYKPTFVDSETESKIRKFIIEKFFSPMGFKTLEIIEAKIHPLDTNTYASFILERKLHTIDLFENNIGVIEPLRKTPASTSL